MTRSANRKSTNKLNVYLEVGSRRTFAAALDWPGWCRMGRDEVTALQALFESGPRYARILRPARLGFQMPADVSSFAVIERLKGNATTDFGAPDVAPASDAQPLDDTELRRLQTLLKACWRAFDSAVEMCKGKVLGAGPRGGGRRLDGIIQHVLGAETGYLSQLGGKVSSQESPSLSLAATRGGSAPKHVQQFLKEGHLRWDSLGEFCALVPSFEHIATTFGNDRARLLAEPLDQAIEKILEQEKSPSRKVHELDTRGSHFYLALYWAESLAAQNRVSELKARFARVASDLRESEAKIVDELNATQGRPVDLGGYYFLTDGDAAPFLGGASASTT